MPHVGGMEHSSKAENWYIIGEKVPGGCPLVKKKKLNKCDILDSAFLHLTIFY